jgi:predicted CXXCH cytochrome family protein
MDWAGSQHQNHNLACVSCHTIHATKDPILVRATQPEKCFSCHAAQRALSMQVSHHPIREGEVICTDCHNPCTRKTVGPASCLSIFTAGVDRLEARPTMRTSSAKSANFFAIGWKN